MLLEYYNGVLELKAIENLLTVKKKNFFKFLLRSDDKFEIFHTCTYIMCLLKLIRDTFSYLNVPCTVSKLKTNTSLYYATNFQNSPDIF